MFSQNKLLIKNKIDMIYDNLKTNPNVITKLQPTINVNFVEGAFVEIKHGEPGKEYKIEMMHDDQLHYTCMLKTDMWARSGLKYYKNWTIKVYNDDVLIYTHKQNFKGKRVFISLESKSLGDTLAWFPYAEEFRKKHDCELVVCTHLNELFKENYPEIEFVEPGVTVHNLYALYRIGWFYDENSQWKKSANPSDFKSIPLQQASSDILGIEYSEIRPKLKLNNKKTKKVGIGIHSTCQAKYWNNPEGWQEVVLYLKELGYEVMLYSKENDGYMGNFQPKGIEKFRGGTLQEVIDDLSTCEFFIGLGSGLSWLAWACDLPIVLISGFSKPFSETTTKTYRVFNEKVCNGCFNSHRLDASDWNWCPINKGTEKQFECTKQISHKMVIEKINDLIKGLSV